VGAPGGVVFAGATVIGVDASPVAVTAASTRTARTA